MKLPQTKTELYLKHGVDTQFDSVIKTNVKNKLGKESLRMLGTGRGLWAKATADGLIRSLYMALASPGSGLCLG